MAIQHWKLVRARATFALFFAVSQCLAQSVAITYVWDADCGMAVLSLSSLALLLPSRSYGRGHYHEILYQQVAVYPELA